ncbi:MAG: ArnT family glycosyltransferase, partial [Candidatus Zixiibacteriota bacterium]
MKLFRYITGSLFVLISVVVMFKFDAVSNFFLFLSPDKVVESYTLLMMWICFISLSSVGFCLLLYDYIIKLIVVIDRRLMSLDVKSFIKYFLLIGFALRLAVILFMPLHLWGDWESYDDMGWQWALKGDYFNGDHLTSYWPPGYPFFLSRLYLIFGHEPIAATAVNIFFSLAIVFLSYLIIRRIWNEQVSRWTMLILIFFPSQILFTNLLATEMLFTSLLLLSIYVFISLNDNLEGKWYFALLGGILLGFASLTRPIAKLYLPLVISFWYFQTRNVKSTVKYSLFALMGFLLTVTPWLIRNYSAIGRARINYNTGINLYIGNQPASGMGYNTYIATEFDSNQPDMEAYVDSLTTH